MRKIIGRTVAVSEKKPKNEFVEKYLPWIVLTGGTGQEVRWKRQSRS